MSLRWSIIPALSAVVNPCFALALQLLNRPVFPLKPGVLLLKLFLQLTPISLYAAHRVPLQLVLGNGPPRSVSRAWFCSTTLAAVIPLAFSNVFIRSAVRPSPEALVPVQQAGQPP